MTVPSLQYNLSKIHADYESNQGFVTTQLKTRGQGFKVLGREFLETIKNLFASIKNLGGVIVRTPIRGVRVLFPNSEKLKKAQDFFPSCSAMRDSASKAARLLVGSFSTLFVGTVVNPNWNYRFHVKPLGLVV